MRCGRRGGWSGGRQFSSGRYHFVRASRDVVVTPLDDDGVAALVLDGIGDIVKLVARVLDVHLLAGGVGSVHAHHQHVGSCPGGATEKKKLVSCNVNKVEDFILLFRYKA